MKPIAEELNELIADDNNMAGFVPLLYSICTGHKKKLRNIVEIGVRSGVSTKAFLYGLRDRGHKNAHLYSIDINNCAQNCPQGLEHLWTFIEGDAREVVWNKEIDVLLIDGDHSYDGVKADYDKYMPFVKDGGLILFHDVLWPQKGVMKFFWEEVKYPKSVLSLSPSGLGVVYKVSPPYYNEDLIRYDISI
jgi:hypothetical protein